MGIIVLILIVMIEWNKKLDRYTNKSTVQDILNAFSLSGIFGFVFEKIVNIFPLQEIGWLGKWPWVFANVTFLIFPILVMIGIVKQKEWNDKID